MVLLFVDCFSESMNNVLQNSVIVNKKPLLYSVLNEVYDFQTSQLLEITKGLWLSKGNKRMDPHFLNKRDKLKSVDIKNSKIYRDDGRREVTNSKAVSRADEDKNYGCKRKEAEDLVENRMVHFVCDGQWMVRDNFKKSWVVSYSNYNCKCYTSIPH